MVAQALDTGPLRGAAKRQDVPWWQVLGWHDDGVTPLPAWFPDEMDLAGQENLGDDHVARYDATIDAHAAAEVEVLIAYGSISISVVAEFGAGTGADTSQFTLEAAHVCTRVIAVDVSPPILRHLQRKVTDRGLVKWRMDVAAV
ncbi:class I SAM-dependent methyltransferase [Rhodoglobus vestalii]|uniref:class I SAM-dependent methyltransferase n=1 Tax=Rhodoglobus vestalii TaxID=193384 RepID=UPI001153E605|nr:class I SAM-dependent methyltransferase [Rhodoglobus vestalii]